MASIQSMTELRTLCSRYVACVDKFSLLKAEIDRLNTRASAAEGADDVEEEPICFVSGRVSVINNLDEMLYVDVPVTVKLLQVAARAVADEISNLLPELDAAVSAAKRKIQDGK